jgi:hypothetical protein
MMKEAVAKQLGSQLGKFIKMDVNFPGYMHVRVEYPLHMALAPELKVKIKGRGVMQITVQYENVSFFCFTCGRMGHAAINCNQGEPEEQAVRYGEELCASPPQRARVITMRQPDLKVVRSLFQATAQEGISIGARPGRPRWSAEQKEKERVADNAVHAKEEKGNDGMQNGKGFVQGDMVAINKSTEGNGMQVEHDDGEAINPGGNYSAKERVSFGTNMTSDEEPSEGNSMVKIELDLAMAVECFHARKFGTKSKKRGALKVNNSGVTKKQKTPIKTSMQGALM